MVFHSSTENKQLIGIIQEATGEILANKYNAMIERGETEKGKPLTQAQAYTLLLSALNYEDFQAIYAIAKSGKQFLTVYRIHHNIFKF